jgi:hypothetical protein
LQKCTTIKLKIILVQNKKEKQTSTTLLNFKNAQWKNLETHMLKTRKEKKNPYYTIELQKYTMAKLGNPLVENKKEKQTFVALHDGRTWKHVGSM